MSIEEAKERVINTSLVYAENQLVNCTEENSTKAYRKCCEQEVEAIKVLLADHDRLKAELDKKDKIIDLMADAIYGEFYSFELNSGKKIKKHFEDLAKEE